MSASYSEGVRAYLIVGSRQKRSNGTKEQRHFGIRRVMTEVTGYPSARLKNI